MKIHPLFTFSEETDQKLLDLLDDTVLGTNGARYRHLDTKEKMAECDRLIHLSMERNERVLGNISFCRRESNWYIRYFAFASVVQGSGTKKSDRSGLLKLELEQFFSNVLHGESGQMVDSFYAYIDPNNTRSLWMSENFGFQTLGRICTQTFSRIRPKRPANLELCELWDEVKPEIEKNYGKFAFYTSVQACKGPFYVLRNEQNEIVAGARFYTANWEIERLPGRFGALLTRLIPWIPGVRKIVRPSNHAFLVPEGVFVKDNDPHLLEQLFEGMLAAEKKHLLLWWTDEHNPVYRAVKDKVNWGLSHRMMGVHHANAVVRGKMPDADQPVYCIGLDFI